MTLTSQQSLFDAPTPAVASFRNRFADPRPRATCEVCGSDDYAEQRIHDDRSLIRHCRRCGRFMGFPIWYGRRLTPAKTEVDST